MAQHDDVALLVESAQTALLSALALLRQSNAPDALRVLAPYTGSDVECAACAIHAYLLLNRTDLALRQLAALKTWAAGDSVLELLAETWLALADPASYQQVHLSPFAILPCTCISSRYMLACFRPLLFFLVKAKHPLPSDP